MSSRVLQQIFILRRTNINGLFRTTLECSKMDHCSDIEQWIITL
jgi:hypothetical protein